MERIVDNKLTPSKIVRLLQLAESATPTQQPPPLARGVRRRVLAEKNVIESFTERDSVTLGSSSDSKTTGYESSSGLLDLDQCEAFGESCTGNGESYTGNVDKLSIGMSYSLSKSFYPSEMTGRSTGTSECGVAETTRTRDSEAIDELAKRLQQQSCDIANIVRDSVYSNFSFKQTQRDLSQDEMSFIRERGELPVPPSHLDMNLTRTHTERSLAVDSTADMSVGSYFMKGSTNLTKMMGCADSPHYEVSMGPSLIEGDSRMYGVQPGFTTINDSDCVILDTTLDRIPTRQPAPSVPSIPPFHSFPHPAPLSRSVHPGHSVIHPGSSVIMDTTIPNVMTSALCDPKLQHLQANSVKTNEDSSLGTDTSLSISLIAKCLGKCDAEVTPSLLFAEAKAKKKNSQQQKKVPLPTRDSNSNQRDTFTINPNKCKVVPSNADGQHVVTLKQAGKSDTASSSSSINTVIQAPINAKKSPFKENKENLRSKSPNMNGESLSKKSPNKLNVKDNTSLLKKSPTKNVKDNTIDYGKGKSPSTSSKTPSTVQENRISTSNVSDSPLQSSNGGEMWWFSPNYEYRELEKSINWQELLLRRLDEGSSQWVEVKVEPVEGYVGICTKASVQVTSITDAYLTALLRLDESSPDNSSIVVDTPRLPVLLTPGVPKTFSITVTAYKPITETINIIVLLQDSSKDTDMLQEAHLCINFTLPSIKIITENKGLVTFPPTQFESESLKSFVIISDCNQSLELALSVSDKPVSGVFSIGYIEEIKREDIQTRLGNDHRLVNENGLVDGAKYRVMKHNVKQVCEVKKGKALRVMMICKGPAFKESNSSRMTVNGSLSVHLMTSNTLLQTVEMTAAIGTIKLLFQMTSNQLYFTTETRKIDIKNVGTINGTWKTSVRGKNCEHFAVTPPLLEVAADATSTLQITHTKPKSGVSEGLLVLESVHEGKDIVIELVAGVEKFTIFPIKASHSELSWVREGRKDISLKNTSDKKFTFNCKIHGEGYFMETPRDHGTELVLTFRPNECIGLSIVYSPREKGCHNAKMTLCLVQDDSVKSVRLNGWCGSGGGHMRWATGVLTCGEMAIAFARRRAPVTLTVENRSRDPSFFSARLLFNMQYHTLTTGSHISPRTGIVAPHSSVQLNIELDWARLERITDAGTSLASVFVLVGPEISRRRIIRMLNKEQPDPTTFPAEDLNRLKEKFPGEDPRLDLQIKNFDETKKSLASVAESIKELVAQIELNKDSAAERTIVLTDETCVEHVTLLDC